MNKLKRFLLVDDSGATNFFNKTIIQKTDCVEEIVLATNGIQALEYVQSAIIPEVIFLDLNMPVMNGWEFLEKYKQFPESFKKSIIVIMLGAKLNPNEESLVKDIPQVKELRDKMLSKDIVLDIVSKYFGNSSL